MSRSHLLAVSGSLLFIFCLAHGQTDPSDSILWFHPNQEVRLSKLPALTAASSDAPVVLATALEIALNDQAVCCGKNSALEDAMLPEPQSLRELSVKLQGKHLSSDDHPIVVRVEYVAHGSINSGYLINPLLAQHASLVEWKSQVYVLYGALFSETRYYSGARTYALQKLFLLDPRFSDQRREKEFNRDSDDWGQVHGLLTLTVERQ